MSLREIIKQAYPYKTWYKRVDKMSDSQVYATYLRLKAKGKI